MNWFDCLINRKRSVEVRIIQISLEEERIIWGWLIVWRDELEEIEVSDNGEGEVGCEVELIDWGEIDLYWEDIERRWFWEKGEILWIEFSLDKEGNACKEEVESLKDTLATMQYQQIADQALQFAQEQGLDESKCKEFVTKCKSGEYEDFKAVQKDIVFAAFEVSGKSQSTGSSKSGEFVFKFPSKPSQVKDYKEDVFEGCRNIIKN